MKITLENLSSFLFDLHPGDRIFLEGNLGAGKTTFSQALIKKHLGNTHLSVTSPTYTYYQQYGDIYHFDLYRVESKEDITRIGAEEIFDDPDSICLIEWPEKCFGTVEPTKRIILKETEAWREISIMNCQAGAVDNTSEVGSISAL